jgi:hypothetical protein
LPETEDASAGRRPKKGKWQQESSFLKKRSKKLFSHGTRWWIEPVPNGQSFFASFLRGHLAVAFSKKEDACLPSCPLPSLTYC